jgi:hypothetical protein
VEAFLVLTILSISDIYILAFVKTRSRLGRPTDDHNPDREKTPMGKMKEPTTEQACRRKQIKAKRDRINTIDQWISWILNEPDIGVKINEDPDWLSIVITLIKRRCRTFSELQKLENE